MKYNKHILNTLLFSTLFSLCLSLCYFTPIHTKSISDSTVSGNAQDEESTGQIIHKGGITYRQRTDGYYDVIAYDKNISNSKGTHLKLVKKDINKVSPEFAAAQPDDYVASIADGVFQDTSFASLSLCGDIDIGAHAFEGAIMTSDPHSLQLGNNAIIREYAFSFTIFGCEIHTFAHTIGEHAFDNACFHNDDILDDVSIFLESEAYSDSLCYTIGDYAFASTNLTSVTFPDTLTSLGIGAFPNSTTLTITIPDTLTNIEAFHLESLTEVTFHVSYNSPAYTTLKNLGLKTMNTDSSAQTTEFAPLETPPMPSTEEHPALLSEPTVPPQNTNTSPVGTLVTQKNAVYKITGTSTASFTEPTNKKITSLTILASIKVSGKKYKVTKVTAKACLKCTKLKRVTLGNNITTIGNSAFAQCSQLQQITFGKNVKTLGKQVLYKDKKLKKIRFQGKKIKSIGKETFYLVPKSVNIEVPISKVSHYVKLINNAK